MATVREQGKPTASPPVDAVVQEQLNRARRRIRLLDLTAASLGFVALVLAYFLGVALLDRRIDLAIEIRQIALGAFVLAGAAYLIFAVLRPLLRPVNPYYAAVELERVVPQAKNSIVNWLDLHEQPLPPVIRAALAQRAARDLGRADIDQALRGRHAVIAGGFVAALLLGVGILYLWCGGEQFRSLVARAFFPFASEPMGKRTRLTLVRPISGDATIAANQSLSVAVRVEGRVPDPAKPDALKLLLRYGEDEPYEEQLLEPEDVGVWATTVPAFRTRQGFLYKVVGGDDETPEYRVTVRAAPGISSFEVTYRYRPYLGWKDRTSPDANLKELRGTEAVIVAHTNRPVKAGQLDLESATGKRRLDAEFVDGDPQALRFRHVLDTDGSYRIAFTTTDGETSATANPYSITVLPDQPPRVELTKPGEDVRRPANGTLKLEGAASDDIGLHSLTLHLQIVDGPKLARRPYRDGRSFRFTDGTSPKTLEYRDFVALDEVKDEMGKPYPLRKGQVLECWLEALDCCDFPEPNRAESRHFRVTIDEPDADAARQKNDRQKAAEEKKDHEKKDDAQRDAEEKQRQEGGAQEGGKGEPEAKPNPEGGDGKDDLEQQAEKIKEALDRKGQDDKDDKSEGKEGGSKDGERSEGKEGAPKDGERSERKGKGDSPEEAAGPKEGGEKAQGPSQAKGQGDKPGAKSDEVAQLEKQMREGGEGERQQAEKRLEEMSRQGNEAAQQALERAKKQGQEPAPSEAKAPPPSQGQPSDAAPCPECKGGGQNAGAAASAGKSGGSGATGGAGGASEAKGGGTVGANTPHGDGEPNATVKAPAGGGRNSGQGARRDGPADGADRAPDTETHKPTDRPDPAGRRHAGALQLEDFSKIDKRLLDELKMSEEEFKAFREAYLKRLKRTPTTPEALPLSQGGNLRNIGAREVKPGDKPRTDDARRSGLGQAPPEFREIFRRYTTGDR